MSKKEQKELMSVIVHNLNVLANAIKELADKYKVPQEDILAARSGFYPIGEEDIEKAYSGPKQMGEDK